MPARKRVTLVVDVNVLVSMLINHDAAGIKSLFNKQAFRVMISSGRLGELEEVLMRPQFRRYLTVTEAERAVRRIANLHGASTAWQRPPSAGRHCHPITHAPAMRWPGGSAGCGIQHRPDHAWRKARMSSHMLHVVRHAGCEVPRGPWVRAVQERTEFRKAPARGWRRSSCPRLVHPRLTIATPWSK